MSYLVRTQRICVIRTMDVLESLPAWLTFWDPGPAMIESAGVRTSSVISDKITAWQQSTKKRSRRTAPLFLQSTFEHAVAVLEGSGAWLGPLFRHRSLRSTTGLSKVGGTFKRTVAFGCRLSCAQLFVGEHTARSNSFPKVFFALF